jgi:hypothetical protein
VSFARACQNQIPWTRQHLYERTAPGGSNGKL